MVRRGIAERRGCSQAQLPVRCCPPSTERRPPALRTHVVYPSELALIWATFARLTTGFGREPVLVPALGPPPSGGILGDRGPSSEPCRRRGEPAEVVRAGRQQLRHASRARAHHGFVRRVVVGSRPRRVDGRVQNASVIIDDLARAVWRPRLVRVQRNTLVGAARNEREHCLPESSYRAGRTCEGESLNTSGEVHDDSAADGPDIAQSRCPKRRTGPAFPREETLPSKVLHATPS